MPRPTLKPLSRSWKRVRSKIPYLRHQSGFHRFLLGLDIVSATILWFSLVVGLILTFLIPPFQKPDEPIHFYKSISVASGRLICQKSDGQVFNDPLPQYLVDFPNQMLTEHVAFKKTIPFPISLYRLTTTRNLDTKVKVNQPASCSLPSILYLPTGLTMAIPIKLGMSPLLIFFLGRLTNLLVSLAIFYLAIRIIPKKQRLIPAFILAMPMVLHQLSSFSKDALHISLGVLAFSLLVRFSAKKAKIKLGELLLFFVSLAVSILARPQYILFSFLPLLISKKKVLKRHLSIKVASMFFIVSIVAVIGLALTLETYSAKAVSLGQSTPLSFVHPNLQVKYLLENPWRLVTILSDSIEENSVFYFRGLFGIFGWLDYELSWYLYLIYLGFFFWVVYLTKKKSPLLSLLKVILLSTILVGTIYGIFLAQYIYGSPVAAKVVRGVQGRYFIIMIPYAIWLATSLWSRFGKKVLLPVMLLVIVSLLGSVGYRYYNYSGHFFRDQTFDNQLNRTDSRLIRRNIRQLLPIDPSRKVAGVSIFTLENEQAVTKPYLIRLYDKSCQQLLGEKVIDTTTLGANKFNDIAMEPIDSNGSNVLCVDLGPYQTLPENEASLMTATINEKGRMAIVPLYLF